MDKAITNRRFVERALKFGFRSVRFYGPDSPAMCTDEHRRFLWDLLDKGSAIPRHDDPQRIDAPSRANAGSAISTTKPQEKVMAVALPAVTRSTAKPSETTNDPSVKSVRERAVGSAHLQKQYWGRHLWARGYFVASSGNVTDEVIRE